MSSCQIHLFNTLPAFLLMLCLFQAVQLLWEHRQFLLLVEAWERRDLVYSANFKDFWKLLSYLFPEFKELFCRNVSLKSLQNTPCHSEFLYKKGAYIFDNIATQNRILHACFRDWCIDCMTKYTHSWERIFLSHLVLLNYIDLFK